MKKILFFFAFSVIVLTFAACGGKDGLNDAYWANWEGEYEATEIVELISVDGETTEISPARTTTITIFRDNYLYVQSYGIGDPFMPGVDPEDHTVRLRTPKRMPADDDPEEEGDEEPEPTGIEEIEVSEQTNRIVLINGGVVSIYAGVVYAPKAIQAVAVTETELFLLPGQPFEVTLMSEDNIDLGTVTCNWTYSPIRKEGDTYTWEAELHQSPYQSSSYTVFGTFRHTLTMTKKSAQ